MSILDKVAAAVMPPESEEERREARETALAAATPGDWLAAVLTHHEEIEAAFEAVRDATTEPAQQSAQKALSVLLTGHSVAEEAVLYPALSDAGEQGHATKAYTEQSAAKLEMGLLEKFQPLSREYLDKLEHIRRAVAHHMFEEEGNWFLELKSKTSLAEQQRMTARYLEEFSRYVGTIVDLSSSRLFPFGPCAIARTREFLAHTLSVPSTRRLGWRASGYGIRPPFSALSVAVQFSMGLNLRLKSLTISCAM